jgi:hypothetical protein
MQKRSPHDDSLIIGYVESRGLDSEETQRA